MKGLIPIIQIDKDRILILDQEYYKKEYLEEMMLREYQRGKKENQQIHLAEIKLINQIEN